MRKWGKSDAHCNYFNVRRSGLLPSGPGPHRTHSVPPPDSCSHAPETQPPNQRPGLAVQSRVTAILIPLLPHRSFLSSSCSWHPRLEDPSPGPLEQRLLPVLHPPAEQRNQRHCSSPSRSSTISHSQVSSLKPGNKFRSFFINPCVTCRRKAHGQQCNCTASGTRQPNWDLDRVKPGKIDGLCIGSNACPRVTTLCTINTVLRTNR